MAIPKRLHIIWIGDESKRPDAFIDSWRCMNPTFSVRLWGNADLEESKWEFFPQIKVWLDQEINGAADVMRWELLYRHGGVAVDADSVCMRPLADWLLEPDCFAVWENEIEQPGLIACGALGCVPHHPLIGKILCDIAQDSNLTGGAAWEKVGPGRITETVRSNRYTGITIYPSHYFIPRHYSGLQYDGSGPIFAIQEWGSSFQSYGQLGKSIEAERSSHSLSKSAYQSMQQTAVAKAEASPSSNIVSRHIGGSFFLQRLKMDHSVSDRLDRLIPLVSGKTVLHIGCVDSPIFDPHSSLHLTLASHISELHGLDIDTAGLAELRKYFDGMYFGDIESCLQHGSHYDLVLVPETIEHVSNAESFLRDIDRIPFDRIAITAPCIYGWCQYGVMSYKENGQSFGPYGSLLNCGSFVEEIHPDHKYWFSPYTLANLIESVTQWHIQTVQLLEDGTQVCVIAHKKTRKTTRRPAMSCEHHVRRTL